MSTPIRCFTGVVPLLACCLGLPSAAQEAPSIAEIRIQGLQTLTEAFVRGQLRTEVGHPYDAETVEEDRRRLLRTGRLIDVATDVEFAPQGAIVTFTLHERAVIRDIRFEGNRKFKDEKLRDLTRLAAGDPLDPFAARQGRLAILDAYREKGYGEVSVELDESALQDGDVIYTIEEGPRVRIRKIEIEGNETFSDRRLRREITSNTYLWIFRDGRFDVDTVEADAAAIRNFYRDEGFLDAQASYRLEFDETRSDLTLDFVVSEGDRYIVADIAIEGDAFFDDAHLLGLMELKPGDIARAITQRRDVERIAAEYHNNGFIYATVEPVRVFLEEKGQVALTLQIDEGERFSVGRIAVRGNQRTRDKVVRRELDLFPGDVFDLSKTKEAEQDLQHSRIFTLARVRAVGNEPGVRDIVMDVEEAAEAGNAIFGVGVTSNNGLVGQIVLDFKNFDLRDTPRSSKEFLKGRAFHGAGQRLRIEAQPGTELSRFRIDFNEPYLFDRPINFGTSLYYFSRGRDAYDERRAGGNFSFGRRIPRGILKDWYGEISFRLEEVTIDNLDLFAAREIAKDAGSDLLTSVKLAIARDQTDSRLLPSEGDIWRFAWEQAGALGGDHAFAKLTGSYTWYRTLYIDSEDRKSVLALRASAAGIFGDAPIYERFYGGGLGNMRGFAFRGVSPREGLTDDAVGGDLMILAGAEYSFPLYADTLRGVFFTDMGTVEESFEITDWRASLGFGVRLVIPALGPIPMEFDFALPVLSDDEDDEQVFSFAIGVLF